MAPIAMAIVLSFGAAPPAAAEGKPCRTPCLSADAVREPPAAEPAKPEATDESKAANAAAKANARTRPPAARSSAYAADKPAERAGRPPPPKRCSSINMRAAVGEPLSEEDMKFLRSQC